MAAEQQLRNGAQQMGLNLSDEQVQLLLKYLGLFEKWNKTYNLSAIRSQAQMVNLHLLDSLSVVPYLEGKTWLDVGTGGGLPGIPLAICLPNNNYTLLDSAGKKTRFLHQVVQELGLDNVKVINDRAENVQLEQGVDGIISRAFASINLMIECTAHLLNSSGQFWAMKGQIPHSELSQIQKGFIVDKVQALNVPGVDAERCLISLKAVTDDR